MLRNENVSESRNSGSKGGQRRGSAAGTAKAKKNGTVGKAAAKRPGLGSQGNLIFSLDIGTRTIVGVVGKKEEDTFTVVASEVVPHSHRAMIDGQIEDIAQVAKVVKRVVSGLESKLGVKLTQVALAAAGRSLKTQQVKIDIDVAEQQSITEEMVKSFEMEAISKAQGLLDETVKDSGLPVTFYCVGHSVIHYYLDDYPIKSFVGHKGKTATVDLIAAFLPNLVVESLYAVMDMVGLEVSSLTLEPIAAMNVIVPADARLINVALVDIGAGTSDIAIAKNGSIVAYAMATIAGDEITEEIIRRYLVDFDTAEGLKLALGEETLSFRDILGYEYELVAKEFLESISPAIENLASTICQHILDCNGGAPAAVFLVGGGSKVPGLPNLVSEKLGVAKNRIAVGGYNPIKYLSLAKDAENLKGPEFVTPIGIGMTATMQKGYDFATIYLNDKKVRVFNREKLSILDLLGVAGFKATNIIGRSGRNLTFTFNGETQFIKGEIATPATLTVNDVPAHVGTPVKQGDKVMLIPAQNGLSAEMSILDFAGELSPFNVTVDGQSYTAGVYATVNGALTDSSYHIRNFDDIKVWRVSTVEELRKTLPFDAYTLDFYRSTEDEIPLEDDTPISAGDVFFTQPSERLPEGAPTDNSAGDGEESGSSGERSTEPIWNPTRQPAAGEVAVKLNGYDLILPLNTSGQNHMFLELTALANLDLQNPQGTGRVIQTLNGVEANYTDTLMNGDEAIIIWEGSDLSLWTPEIFAEKPIENLPDQAAAQDSEEPEVRAEETIEEESVGGNENEQQF